MMIPLKTEINPKGRTTEEKQNDLIRQLRQQNTELKNIIADLYRQIEGLKK